MAGGCGLWFVGYCQWGWREMMGWDGMRIAERYLDTWMLGAWVLGCLDAWRLFYGIPEMEGSGWCGRRSNEVRSVVVVPSST